MRDPAGPMPNASCNRRLLSRCRTEQPQWMFLTISDRTNYPDEFRVFSQTYRSDESTIVLPPLRDRLCPELSPLGIRMTLAVTTGQPTRRRIPRDRSGSRERRPISGPPTLPHPWRDIPFQGKAIRHFETVLGTVPSSFCCDDPLARVHCSLARGLFFNEDRFGDAHAHIERTNSRADNGTYYLSHATELQARLWIEDVGLRRQDTLRC